MDLKPIETIYDGYRFRSRLEARWAVFMDACGLRFDYEPEGYNLDGVLYLPDFWVHPQKDEDGHDCVLGFWLEVKGTEVKQGSRDWEKVRRLAVASCEDVCLFTGPIDRWQRGLRLRPYEDDEGEVQVEVNNVTWRQCPLCHRVEPAESMDRMSCLCVLIASERGLVEEAQLKARQARFEHRRRNG